MTSCGWFVGRKRTRQDVLSYDAARVGTLEISRGPIALLRSYILKPELTVPSMGAEIRVADTGMVSGGHVTFDKCLEDTLLL